MSVHESALRGGPATLLVAETPEGGGGGSVSVGGDEVLSTAGACPADVGPVSVRGEEGVLFAGGAEGDSEYVGGNSTEILPSRVEG